MVSEGSGDTYANGMAYVRLFRKISSSIIKKFGVAWAVLFKFLQLVLSVTGDTYR